MEIAESSETVSFCPVEDLYILWKFLNRLVVKSRKLIAALPTEIAVIGSIVIVGMFCATKGDADYFEQQDEDEVSSVRRG